MAGIDGNNIRRTWSTMSIRNKLMTKMMTKTDSVYYELHYSVLANIVDQSAKEMGHWKSFVKHRTYLAHSIK